MNTRINPAFVRLFISYAVVLLFPLMILTFIFSFTTRKMTDQAKNVYQTSLNQAADLIDMNMKSISNLAEVIYYDKDVNDFINARNNTDSRTMIYNLFSWKDVLTKYRRVNANIENIILISERNNYILSTGSAARLNCSFFESYMLGNGLSYDMWNEEMKGRRFSDAYISISNGSDSGLSLVYIKSISDNYSRLNHLVIVIDTGMIEQLLAQVTDVPGSLSVAVDHNGNIITQHGNMLSADIAGLTTGWNNNGQAIAESMSPMVVSSDESAAYAWRTGVTGAQYVVVEAGSSLGWRFVSLIPLDSVMNSVNLVKRQILYLSFIIMVSGVAICIYMSKNKATVLKRITAYLTAEVPKNYLRTDNDYIYIENAVARLINHNKDYQSLNDEQSQLLGYELIRRLLLGEYTDINQMAPLISHSKLVLYDRCFAIIAIINDAEAGQYDQDEQLIKAFAGNTQAITCQIENRTVMLFVLDKEMRDGVWLDYSTRIIEEYLANTLVATHLKFCVSRVYNQIKDIHKAYDEVVVLIEYTKVEVNRKKIIFRTDRENTYDNDLFYYYPIDVELQLISAVKTGNVDVLKEILNSIYYENFYNKSLSIATIRQLVFEIRGTIIRSLRTVINDETVNDMIMKLYNETTIDGIIEHAIMICTEMCRLINRCNEISDDEIKQTIYSFIISNHSNPSLTVYDLMACIRLSETKVNDCIRRLFNSTFAKLLETTRINKACELLATEKLQIKDIASRVGYINDHTFRQAYKRVMNMTPSEFLLSL